MQCRGKPATMAVSANTHLGCTSQPTTSTRVLTSALHVHVAWLHVVHDMAVRCMVGACGLLCALHVLSCALHVVCYTLCAACCVLHIAPHASAVRVTSVFSSVPSTGHAQQRMSQRRVGDQHKEHASGATLSICTCGLRVLVSTGTMGRGNPREGGSCALRCTTAFERGAPLTQHTLPRSLPFALPKRLGASEEEVVHAERTAARRTNSAGRTNPTHSDT